MSLRTLVLHGLALTLSGDVLRAPVAAQSGAAFLVRSLATPRDRREARPEILDTPVLPGSVMKAVTLVAALEAGVIQGDTEHMCRRSFVADGRRYTCAHPDLKRPLSPAEALAHSCNDFFVSLAPRLSRSALNRVRTRVGLTPVAADASLSAALVGLDGPRVTPRTLLDVLVRLVGADRDRSAALDAPTRAVLIEGLRGAAQYGSASAFGARGVSALAKTGTAPMPGGSAIGLVVALSPVHRPTHGLVVVAPGAAGLDAAAIAADLLAAPKAAQQATSPPAPSDDVTLRVAVTGLSGTVTTRRLGLEDYVAQVLAGEGEPRAGDGAQQALAITARTFALANLNRHRREDYDLCDTTHCQVLRAATETTRRAAQATAGRVLMREGQPASVFYSALCGGRSELASEVWPGAVDLVTMSRSDEACEDEPAWTSEVRAGDIERALRGAGHRGDRLRDLRVLDRNGSGRVARVRVEGFTPNEVSGHEFRMAVGRIAGWQAIKSTAFDVRRTGAGFRFTGRGFGHGVGLCVIGAGRRAAAGASADDILRFYFPTLRVEPYRASAALTIARPAPTSPAASPQARDVLVALPADEEPERARVIDLVRRARDRMAAATGVTMPAVIRVTVHATVEAFGRATGQPWWISGATDGTSIDVLPLNVLIQQGQLDRTLTHEVAHVLLDEALRDRPLWVREGAAFYFADPTAPFEPPARITCPTDQEFLRPISAGAHRGAYARAETCFRRAIASGRTWREVR